MSNIKKLLEGVEVEWKTLGEITNILRGKRLTRNLLSANDKYPVFHGGLDPLGYYYNANRPADTVMIINVGASAGTVGYSSVDFWSSDGTYCIEQMAKLNNKFLYYFLLGEQYYLKSRVRVAGIPTLDAFVIEKLQIPIPYPNNLKKSLEIQQEIVRILDSFSMLTAELQAELQARKSQYEYYRNQLLAYPMEESDQSSLRSNRSATSIQNSDNSIQPLSTLNPPTGNSVLQPRGKVEWKVLEEVVEIKRGKRLIKNQLEKTGKYAVYQNCMIPLGYYHKNNVIADTTFIISAGSAGEIGYSDVDFWAADDVYYFVTKNDLKSRFLYHFLITQQQKIYSQVRRSSVPRLSKTAFEKLLIPIPSLEEQEHIVSILDKFDALTTSLTEGLPKEIELRQKQYEYYRNMLLSFPKNNIKA
ncbi:restriction endonuclease subunit S [Bacteroides stercoris]|jgi:type I restriction enzyme S subunit|uniref:Restriction endonuclease subunit S n=1 Tax=Bacteroides stercoris TaxID=46506 RepID=A0A413E1A1_BACSE|nr:restriction endonuclease subunit S [Bacteroides stercoris]MEE0589084.1 restriction endonuclease subunit S [Bacteroides stercoris]RGW96607.1 restriction endonuclease subunit S [Bacteroides stercoris]